MVGFLKYSHIYPVIHSAYLLQQQADEGIHLSGDGRCDSPGYSAKYCTYSIMDRVSDLILDYNLVLRLRVQWQWKKRVCDDAWIVY